MAVSDKRFQSRHLVGQKSALQSQGHQGGPWPPESFPQGQPWWLSGLALPSAQGMILETQDQVSCQAPHMEPASPSACVSASLCLSRINEKTLKKKKKQILCLAPNV